jgi:hypothetical protein
LDIRDFSAIDLQMNDNFNSPPIPFYYGGNLVRVIY